MFRNTEVAGTNPKVIIEVLSDGTAGYDLGQQRNHYLKIASLEEIIFVEQNLPLVQTWRKNPEGLWEIRFYSEPEEKVEVNSLGITIPLEEIYHKVRFSEQEPK